MTTIPKPSDLTAGYTGTYDAWNRLVKLVDGANTVAEYEYDGGNRRIVKSIYSGGTLDHRQHVYYNQAWQVLEVRKEVSGTEDTDPLEQYVWHPYYVDALVLRDYDADVDGTSVRHYYTQDANFNVTAVIDDTGSVVERYHYTPYGHLAVLDADFSDDADGISDIANAVAFTGRRFDSETGLFYYRNRMYHAQLGRFASRDPIGYRGSINLYQYVESSPLSFLDPLGLWTFVNVHDFFSWYYIGGGQPVDLPSMAPGVFNDWQTAIQGQVATFKNQTMGEVLSRDMDCDRPNARIAGSTRFNVNAGGGSVTDPLTVLGSSNIRVQYSCRVAAQCETCSDGCQRVVHITANCTFSFSLRDWFSNPLDWNGPGYRRNDAAYQSCRRSCRSRYASNRRQRNRCLRRCAVRYPRSEFMGATRYRLTGTWSEAGNLSEDQPGCGGT